MRSTVFFCTMSSVTFRNVNAATFQIHHILGQHLLVFPFTATIRFFMYMGTYTKGSTIAEEDIDINLFQLFDIDGARHKY